jgi:hypothetical protein
MKKKEAKPPIIEKELLLEVEKTFRRFWEKEKRTQDIFKKAASLHEQIQSLLVQELCKPETEQDTETIADLRERLRDTEENIDTIADLTKELQELRAYFFGFLSEPREAEEK